MLGSLTPVLRGKGLSMQMSLYREMVGEGCLKRSQYADELKLWRTEELLGDGRHGSTDPPDAF